MGDHFGDKFEAEDVLQKSLVFWFFAASQGVAEGPLRRPRGAPEAIWACPAWGCKAGAGAILKDFREISGNFSGRFPGDSRGLEGCRNVGMQECMDA